MKNHRVIVLRAYRGWLDQSPLRHRRWFYFLFYFLRRDVVRHHQNLVLSALIRLPNSSNFKHENIFILPTMTLFIREHFSVRRPEHCANRRERFDG